ncbi:MAG: hypothetical protein GY866_24895 [Proteobacteria bacterium]|nr:hypothetical protein [Pseudomonadota bacterium]
MLALRKKDELYAFSETLQKMADKLIEDVKKFGVSVSEIEEINSGMDNRELTAAIKNLNSILNGYSA